MIITRTPFRISFFGGGTDYPVWFKEHGGAVVGTTIDKYCYITCRYLPPFFEHKHRIVYSLAEHVRSIDEIRHPAVREIFRFMDVQKGIEVHHDGDLPARTGLGSSSSFTVGLLHAMHVLTGRLPTKMQLANEAIHIEQEVLGENVGCQDQVMAAVGGLNRIGFSGEGEINIEPVAIKPERLNQFHRHLMLYFTGLSRMASDIAGEQIKETPNRERELGEMFGMVDEAIDILTGDGDLAELGRLLHENWQLKRSLTEVISTPYTDFLYETALNSGALGGKLLGAGGGGFLLFFVPPERQPEVRQALKGVLHVPFRFESGGSQIIFSEPEDINGDGA